MSFIEFLMEYYIYILVVLIILIIGVIGFLVDSWNKGKKDKEVVKKDDSVDDEGLKVNTNNVSSQVENANDLVNQQAVNFQQVSSMTQKDGLQESNLQNNDLSQKNSSNINLGSNNSQEVSASISNGFVVNGGEMGNDLSSVNSQVINNQAMGVVGDSSVAMNGEMVVPGSVSSENTYVVPGQNLQPQMDNVVLQPQESQVIEPQVMNTNVVAENMIQDNNSQTMQTIIPNMEMGQVNNVIQPNLVNDISGLNVQSQVNEPVVEPQVNESVVESQDSSLINPIPVLNMQPINPLVMDNSVSSNSSQVNTPIMDSSVNFNGVGINNQSRNVVNENQNTVLNTEPVSGNINNQMQSTNNSSINETQNNVSNSAIYTSDGSQPFDISSMFANNK